MSNHVCNFTFILRKKFFNGLASSFFKVALRIQSDIMIDFPGSNLKVNGHTEIVSKTASALECDWADWRKLKFQNVNVKQIKISGGLVLSLDRFDKNQFILIFMNSNIQTSCVSKEDFMFVNSSFAWTMEWTEDVIRQIWILTLCYCQNKCIWNITVSLILTSPVWQI